MTNLSTLVERMPCEHLQKFTMLLDEAENLIIRAMPFDIDAMTPAQLKDLKDFRTAMRTELHLRVADMERFLTESAR
jgi:hypothetical protein